MTNNVRRARVSCDGEGDPVGCAIFLTARQLWELSIDPETTEMIEYVVVDGGLQLQKQPTPYEQRTHKSHGTVDESRGEATDD